MNDIGTDNSNEYVDSHSDDLLREGMTKTD